MSASQVAENRQRASVSNQAPPYDDSRVASSSGCTVSPVETADEWNDYVRSVPEATGYHLWQWKKVFEHGLGLRTHYLAAREAADIVGVLPLVEVRGPIFGRALSSLPYVNYGGVLGASAANRRLLRAEARRLARQRRLSFVLFRHERQTFPDLPARTHKVTMLLALKPDADAMWNGLDRKVRNQIRKAEKSNVTTVSGGQELLDDFYRVFARNMRDLGSPVYGKELFHAILEQFPQTAAVHLAQLNGSTIAGAFSYAYGRVVEVPSASSLKEYRVLCPNHILYWSIIKDAIRQGRTTFDFGRSTMNDNTYQFKAQWGAQPEQIWWEYDMLNHQPVPTDDRQSGKFHTSIEIWKRLPVAVATVLGPRIARSVP
jgi:FemAB-related protein (PEP-CTERM system-associated)